MSGQSRLQELPECINAAVANLLAFRSTRPSPQTDVDSNGDSQALLPLLAVSSKWRLAALDCISQWRVVEIGSDGRCSVHHPLNPLAGVRVPLPPQSPVTQVKAMVDCGLFGSDSGLALLASSIASCAPTLATKHLSLEFVAGHGLHSGWTGEPRVPSGLKQLLAGARTVDVKFGSAASPMDLDLIGQLNAALGPMTDAAGIRRWCSIAGYLEPPEALISAPVGLAAINFVLDSRCLGLLELVAANRATLQRLEIAVVDVDRLSRLFVTADRDPVLYPMLEALTIKPHGSIYSPTTGTLCPAEYCPRLRYLHVGILCPLYLGMIIRSCYESLEHVDLLCDHFVLDMLLEEQEATRGRSTRVKHVTIRRDDTFARCKFIGPNTVPVAFGFAPSTTSIELISEDYSPRGTGWWTLCDIWLEHLTTVTDKHLEMDSDTLTMMVRSLPQLQRIKCKSVSLSPKLEAVSATKRPHFVRQTYYPLEGSLMELDMWDPDMDAGKLVMFVLAVKLMCPSFAFANVAEGLVSKCRESFKEEKRNTHYRLYLHELANVHWRVTRQ